MTGLIKHIFLYISGKQWSLPVCLFICLLSCSSIPPSSEGEESRGFIKALIRGSGQEETSLASLLPAHPQPLIGRPRCHGHRPHTPSSPPSPPRSLRFLPNGITGASRVLSNWERHGGGHRVGAAAQEVRLPGHQLPHVAPGNSHWQPSDGPATWTQTTVQGEVGTHTYTQTNQT